AFDRQEAAARGQADDVGATRGSVKADEPPAALGSGRDGAGVLPPDEVTRLQGQPVQALAEQLGLADRWKPWDAHWPPPSGGCPAELPGSFLARRARRD